MKNKFLILAMAASIPLIMGIESCGSRLLHEANANYENYNYATAAQQYENYLIVSDSSDTEAMLKLADCYREMNRYSDAVKWYAKAVDSDEATSEHKLYYAQMLHAAGNREEAKTQYDVYLLDAPDDSIAKRHRASLDIAIEDVTDPFYEVDIAPVVSNSSVFSPTIYNGVMYYSAEAPTVPGQPVNEWTGHGFLNIYQAEPDKFDDAKELDKDLNSDLHESNIVLTDNGNKAYFTRSSMKEVRRKKQSDLKPAASRDNTNHFEICSAELVDGKWTNVKVLPFNSKEFSSGHPALTGNGNRMYFVSDRPGGLGGTDLYYSDLVNGEWSEPVNAGPIVNTAGDEMFPAMRISTDKEYMYFSSDGWAGLGGLDVYRVELVNGKPQYIMHLPVPFNSPGDDFGITFAEETRTGYFSSNRESENGDDRIYKFKHRHPNYFVHLTVLDKETSDRVPNTSVEIKDERNEKTWSAVTDAVGTLLFPADSMTEYEFKLFCNEYFCGYDSTSTPDRYRGKFNDTTYVVAYLDKIALDKAYRLENIYYDFDKWHIRTDAARELDKLVKMMQDNPQIKIELSSHADSRGTDQYNQVLTQKRAQSAVDYIISKGISRERITARGYGESKLLNRCADDVKCSEEEHQWNRRTEFKVVEIKK